MAISTISFDCHTPRTALFCVLGITMMVHSVVCFPSILLKGRLVTSYARSGIRGDRAVFTAAEQHSCGLISLALLHA